LKVFTIGFTKTSTESFFMRLQEAGVKKVIDVRLARSLQDLPRRMTCIP
jgi:hypothetical protein